MINDAQPNLPHKTARRKAMKNADLEDNDRLIEAWIQGKSDEGLIEVKRRFLMSNTAKKTFTTTTTSTKNAHMLHASPLNKEGNNNKNINGSQIRLGNHSRLRQPTLVHSASFNYTNRDIEVFVDSTSTEVKNIVQSNETKSESNPTANVLFSSNQKLRYQVCASLLKK